MSTHEEKITFSSLDAAKQKTLYESDRIVEAEYQEFLKLAEIMPCLKFIAQQPEFLRLEHIHQLESAFVVFPGATHSRYEHSIGVCLRAVKLFDILCELNFNKAVEERDDEVIYKNVNVGEEIINE
jgi:HD superfamily phosphohydrolase